MTSLLGCVNQLGDLVLAFAELLLQMAKQFLLLTLRVVQVIIGEVGELLPELSFQLMPFTFELELVHCQVRMAQRLMTSLISFNLAMEQLIACCSCA